MLFTSTDVYSILERRNFSFRFYFQIIQKHSLNFFEKEIIADDFKILKRILFLLRIACTDISATQNIEIIKPKGKGWEEVIALIYKHKTDFFATT